MTEYKPTIPNTLYTVRVDDFDVVNYELSDFKCVNLLAIINYKYQVETCTYKKRCILITNPIKMLFGGIPRIDGVNRLTENDCMYFWLPLFGDQNACNLLTKVLEPVDVKNNNFVPQLYDNFEYTSCVKKFFGTLKVLKVGIFNIFSGVTDEREIKMKVYVDNGLEPSLIQPEEIKSMSDLRKLFTIGSTIQFALEFRELLPETNEPYDVRKCTMNVKCLQIYITKLASCIATQ